MGEENERLLWRKNPRLTGHLSTDCNYLDLIYCDGASFSGHKEKQTPVPGQPGRFLHFRGRRNIDATIEYALSHLGLDAATEVVLTGNSADGAAILFHADRIANAIRQRATAAHIMVLSMAGWFPDHKNYLNSANTFAARMKYVYDMQGVGGAASLPPPCLASYPETPHYCFLAQHMSSFVQVLYTE